VPALDMTNTKSLIYPKVVTVKEVTSRPSMSCRGKKRPRTAALNELPRDLILGRS
jgi:hypothetical protein